MIDPNARPISYLWLMVLVALLGIISAVITFAFIVIVNAVTDLIWEQALQTSEWYSRLFTIII